MTDCVLVVKQLCVQCRSPHTLLVGVVRNELPDQMLDNYTPCIETLSQAISKDFFVYCMRKAGEQELRFRGTFTTNIYKCLKRHIGENVLNLSLLATIYIFPVE